MKEKILILDESGIFIRNALGGTKDLSTTEGMCTGGVFGYIKTVFGVIERFKPKYVICAVDSKERQLYRKDKFPAYKMNRKKSMSVEIKDFHLQKENIKRFNELFGIPMVSKPGYEADDIIASLATQYEAEGHEVYILSSDKDFVQLLNKSVNLVLLGKHDKTDEFEVVTPKDNLANVFGIDPSKAQCYQGIVGDGSDNYPGVISCGPVAAKKMLDKYHSLEAIYDNLNDPDLFFDKKGKPNSLREKLTRELTEEELDKYMLRETKIRTVKELAFLCREIATLEKDLDLKKEQLLFNFYEEGELKPLLDFFEELEFYSFLMMFEGVA